MRDGALESVARPSCLRLAIEIANCIVEVANEFSHSLHAVRRRGGLRADRAALLLPQPLSHRAVGGDEVPAHQHRADQPAAQVPGTAAAHLALSRAWRCCALALARPITSAARGTGRGDAVDAVFVIDISYSMGASDGAVSRFERAKDRGPRSSSTSCRRIRRCRSSTCADRAESRGPRSPSNLDQARQLIQNLELTSLATDLSPGVVEAKARPRARPAPEQGTLPLQRHAEVGLGAAGEQPRQRSQGTQGQSAAIYLVRCGDAARRRTPPSSASRRSRACRGPANASASPSSSAIPAATSFPTSRSR